MQLHKWSVKREGRVYQPYFPTLYKVMENYVLMNSHSKKNFFKNRFVKYRILEIICNNHVLCIFI